jgi:hypothetical protein
MASKQKIAYYRKLYLAQLIDSDRHDLISLESATGMPRRTLQDSIKAMDDVGIECRFVQDGPKHRHGYYEILGWGDHSRGWIADHLAQIEALLRS